MKIYCMSDIHGFLDQFKENLSVIDEYLKIEDNKLILLGDYIHGGIGNYEVCHTIIRLQEKYGTEKIMLNCQIKRTARALNLSVANFLGL